MPPPLPPVSTDEGGVKPHSRENLLPPLPWLGLSVTGDVTSHLRGPHRRPNAPGNQRHPLTRTRFTLELRPPAPGAPEWEPLKQNGHSSLPFSTNHEGAGLEARWDRPEKPPCFLSAARGRRTPPPPPREAGREQQTSSTPWALAWTLSPDSFGRKVTVERRRGQCLVCVEEALISSVIYKASSYLVSAPPAFYLI